MNNRILLILFGLMILCCHSNPTPNYTIDDAPKICARLCDTLVQHRCFGWMGSPGEDEQFGTTDDVACTEQCISSIHATPWLINKAVCSAAAADCDHVDLCMEDNP